MQRTVLIAEDNAANQEYLTALLTAFGYNIQVASDGGIALEQVTQSMPDLLLLDIDMPVPSGLEVIAILRNNPRYASLPVVAVTAYRSGQVGGGTVRMHRTPALRLAVSKPRDIL